jgi:type IV pilus assembly protein PilQ
MLAAVVALGTSIASLPAAEDTAAAPAPAQPPPAVGTAPAAGDAGTAPPGQAKSDLSANGKIELHVKDDDLSNVLELLSQQYRLNIVASKGATGKVTADLYDVTIEEALDAVCRAADLGWRRENGVIYIYTAQQLQAMAQDISRFVTGVFELNYLSAAEAVNLLEPLKSEKGTVTGNVEPETGIPSGTGDTGGNSFCLADTVVVRDFPENVERMNEVIRRMDRRPRQVLVEATILRATLNDNTSLGVDFNVLSGIDFRDLSDTNVPIRDVTSNMDPTNPGAPAMTVPAEQKPFGNVSQVGFAGPGPGLNIGVMTNNVSLFIRAMEAVTDTTVISNPKVLALNKQRAEVMIGERLGYLTTTVTETSAVQAVEFIESGTQLIFRPFIGDDGYVRMEIHPEVSTGEIVNDLPREDTTEVTCNVMVKDGHTIVIGGLFDEDVSIARSQVPGLGNIPGLGWLFRSKTDQTIRNEYVILLTPHIIEHEEDTAALGESVRSDFRRRALGIREGFSFFTRERITVGYVQAAEEAWGRYQDTGSKADLDTACWNVQVATNIAPNNLDALRLKDKVLTAKNGEPYTPPDVTIWNNIHERLRMIDKARGVAFPRKPAFEVPKKAPSSGSRPAADEVTVPPQPTKEAPDAN